MRYNSMLFANSLKEKQENHMIFQATVLLEPFALFGKGHLV